MVEQTVGAQASETTELKSLEPQSVSENKRLWQFFWRTWAGFVELRGPNESGLPVFNRPYS